MESIRRSFWPRWVHPVSEIRAPSRGLQGVEGLLGRDRKKERGRERDRERERERERYIYIYVYVPTAQYKVSGYLHVVQDAFHPQPGISKICFLRVGYP